MKKKLLSILLVLCMLVASFAVLASCEKDDKDKKPGGDPAIDAKKGKIVTLLTADSLKGIVADVIEAAGEVAGTEFDPAALLEDVNVYGAFGGNSLAIKDGGLVAVDGTDRFALTFKDGNLLLLENGVVTQHIPLSFEIPEVDDLGAMTEEINAAIDMAMSFVPAITVADIEYKDGWFCFTEAYLAKAVKDTIAKQFAVPEGYEPTADELAAMQAQLEAMNGMVDTLFASVDVTIGFAIDGEAINGFKVAVAVADLAALAGAMMPEPMSDDMTVADLMSGKIEVSLEAKLSADLSKFAYFDVYADMDATVEGTNAKETFDVRVEYANNTLTTSVDIDFTLPEQDFDITATLALAHDANNVPTVFTADVDVALKGMQVSTADGYYGEVPVEAYGFGDVTLTADVLIDLTKLAGSGKVIDADVTLATSNVVIKTYVNEDVIPGITEEMIIASLPEDMKAELLNPETLNGAFGVELTTENGAGKLTATMGEDNSIEVDIAVNAEGTVALNQAEKDAVEAYVPAENPENEITLEELMSGYMPAPED